MKKHSSLRWKIAKYLGLFTILIVTVIFIFQILLLEPMYESNKIDTIEDVATAVEESLESNDFESFVMTVQSQSDTCIVVYDENSTMNTTAHQRGCILDSLRSDQTEEYITKAIENGGSYLTRLHIEPIMQDGSKSVALTSFDNIIYTKVTQSDDAQTVIMVSGSISPLSATITTLSMQLIYIAIFLFIAMMILTWIIYSKIAKPLTLVTESAKTLPQGKYDKNEKVNQYREVYELNETLSKAADDISKADKAKRDLISNVSHDLRTPLTMISGYGEMMMDLPEEKTDENLRVIVDETKRLNALVNDLLDLSRLQDQRIILQEENFDLTQLIKSQMRKYEVYVVQDNYKIEQHLCDSAIVYADRKRIEQVINNFMTNAVNYGGDNPHIIVRETIHDKCVRVEVQDFGEGIAEEDLPNVWDRYYKVDKIHVRVQNGSGIGLSIVKEVLDLHHAKYGVESKKNEGSTFWFELPLAEETLQ